MRTAWALGLLLPSTLPLVVQAQFDYTTDNGKVTITRYTGTGGEVSIPNSIDGLPVTIIGNGAFRDSGVTSVEIPEGVTSLGDYAFYGCNALTGISIPDSVTTISLGSFADCSSLTNVTIPNKVTIIAESLFARCTSLTSVKLPEGVAVIENYALGGCTSLTRIEIPASVTSIIPWAFDNY